MAKPGARPDAFAWMVLAQLVGVTFLLSEMERGRMEMTSVFFRIFGGHARTGAQIL